MNPFPPLSNHHPSASHLGLMGLTTIAIFIIDVFLPLGVAGGIPYILVILLSLRHRNSQMPIWAAIGCSSLTILGIFLSPTGGEFWKVLTNRGLALFAIWTTTLMGRYHLQQAKTLQAQEKTIQDFTATMPTACFSFDREGKILSWNRAAEHMYGYSQKEAVGASSYDLIVTPETHEDTKNVIAAIFQGKTFESMIWHDRNKQGKLGWRTGNLFPVLDPQGQVSYGVNINIDITEQKAAESKLQSQKALLEAILNSSTDAIYAKDHEGKHLLVNQTAAQLMGKQPEAIIGLDNAQLFDPETAEILNQFDEMAFSHTQSLKYEGKLTTHGRTKVFSTIKSPLKDSMGKTFGLVGISRDITDLKQTQKDLLLTDRVFMASNDHISILGKDYRYRRVNPIYEQIHGKSSQELLGMSVADLLGEEVFTQTVKPKLDRCFQGEDVNYEAWFKFADDQNHYMAISYLPLTLGNKEIQEVVVIARDWTERKKIEIALKESESRLQAIMDNSPGLIFLKDLEGHYLHVNQKFKHVFDLEEEIVIGRTDAEVFSAEEAFQFKTHDRRVIESQKGLEFEEVVWLADGPHTSIVHKFPLFNSKGEMFAIVGITTDITARKFAEEALRKSEERFRTYFETGLVGMTITSLDKNWLEVNDRLCAMLGYTREELLKKTWAELTYPDDLLRDEAQFKRLLSGPLDSYSMAKRFVRKDGSLIYTNLYVNAVRMPSGQVEYVTAMLEDITQQKEAEAQLRDNELFTNSILENLPNMVFVKDAKALRFVRLNQAGETLLGYSREELLGKNDFDLFPQNEASFFTSKDRAVLTEGKLIDIPEESIHTKNYGIRILHTKKLPLCDSEGIPRFLLGISEDITERRQAEVDLLESEQRFRTMFEQAAVGVAQIASKTGEFVRVNQRYCDIVGYSQEEMRTKTFQVITHPDDLQADLDNMTSLLSREIEKFSMEKRYKRKDGRLVWVNLTVSPMWQVGEDPSHHIAIVEDITERKNMENTIRQQNEELELEVDRRTSRIQELEQRRMQVEKLAALAQIAAGVAHEINNPLASISQSLILLKRAIPTEHPHFRYMAKVEDCIARIAQITKHLYQLYRPSSPTPTRIDIRTPIQNAMEIMHPRASKHEVSLTLVDSPTPLFATIPSGELMQVLCNLIQNAIETSPPHDTVEVSVGSELKAVTISVLDHGPGISPDVVSHIFEPFFTTKQGQAEGGMGLGLSISHSLIKALGGTLDFSTSIGRGSTFTISLPRT